jgi:predicted dehydrogenase
LHAKAIRSLSNADLVAVHDVALEKAETSAGNLGASR